MDSGLKGLQERLRNGFLEEQTGGWRQELDIPWGGLVSRLPWAEIKLLVHLVSMTGLCLLILWVAASPKTQLNLSVKLGGIL